MLATTAPGAGVPDISVSVGSYLSVEASSLICRDPSHSDNASILSVLLELVLSSCSLYYICFISRQITLSRFVRRFCPTAPLLQGELVDALPNVTTLS